MATQQEVHDVLLKLLVVAGLEEKNVVEPTDLKEALRQLAVLRERVLDLTKAVRTDQERINHMTAEVAIYRQSFDALRECLGTYTEAEQGWYHSARVPLGDYQAWQRAAGL